MLLRIESHWRDLPTVRTSCFVVRALALVMVAIFGLAERVPVAAGAAESGEDDWTRHGIVFVQATTDQRIQRAADMDLTRSTFILLDNHAAPRPGNNLMTLIPAAGDGKLRDITPIKGAYVADPAVSYDGKTIIFSMATKADPWYHLYVVSPDGTGLKQLTSGEADDVSPQFLPDGKIVFISNRSGVRGEYHGHRMTAVHRMNADGSGIELTSMFNCTDEFEPAVTNDGRVVFSRWQVFQCNAKNETLLHSMNPDGTNEGSLYGHIRRPVWKLNRYKGLQVTHPRQMPDGRFLCMTQFGPALFSNQHEEVLLRDVLAERNPSIKGRFCTPEPLSNGKILTSYTDVRVEKLPPDPKNPKKPPAVRNHVDHGVYLLDFDGGQLNAVYDNPGTSEIDAVALAPRTKPPVFPDKIKPDEKTARFACMSIFDTRDSDQHHKIKYCRVIASVSNAYRLQPKNHLGVVTQVLGTVPVASDGSLFFEAPADTNWSLQAYNELGEVVRDHMTWVYGRPGEIKVCAGCHGNRGFAAKESRCTSCHEKPDAKFLAKDHPKAVRLGGPLFTDEPGTLQYRGCVNVNGESANIRGVSTREDSAFVEGVNLVGNDWGPLWFPPAETKHPASTDLLRELKRLEGRDASQRRSAAINLGWLKARSSGEALIKALDDSDEGVRREAVLALIGSASADAVDPLIDRLADRNWAVRSIAHTALLAVTGQSLPFEPEAKSSVRKAQAAAWAQWWKQGSITWCAELRKRLTANPNDRYAIKALAHLGGEADVETLIAVVSKAKGTARSYAIRALGSLRAVGAVDLLARIVESEKKDPHLGAAVEALGQIGGPKAARALVYALDHHAETQIACWRHSPTYRILLAMANVGPQACRSAVPRVLLTTECDVDRLTLYELDTIERLIRHIVRLDGRGPQVVQTVLELLDGKPTVECKNPALAKALKAEDMNIQSPLSGLGHSTHYLMLAATDARTAPQIAELLKHRDLYVRWYAARTLGLLGNRDVVPQIIAALQAGPREATVPISGHMDKHRYGAPFPRYRWALAEALSYLPTSEGTKALMAEAADHRNISDTRYAALKGLSRIGTPQVVPVLQKAARDDFNSICRDLARQSVEQLETGTR